MEDPGWWHDGQGALQLLVSMGYNVEEEIHWCARVGTASHADRAAGSGATPVRLPYAVRSADRRALLDSWFVDRDQDGWRDLLMRRWC
jgi:hypothetical protein